MSLHSEPSRFGATLTVQNRPHRFIDLRAAAGDALDYEVIKQTPDAFEVNVTGCRYAEFYKKLGVPELGFLLTCSADFTMAEGYGANVELKRTQTIMQGASHCDFRYARKKS